MSSGQETFGEFNLHVVRFSKWMKNPHLNQTQMCFCFGFRHRTQQYNNHKLFKNQNHPILPATDRPFESKRREKVTFRVWSSRGQLEMSINCGFACFSYRGRYSITSAAQQRPLCPNHVFRVPKVSRDKAKVDYHSDESSLKTRFHVKKQPDFKNRQDMKTLKEQFVRFSCFGAGNQPGQFPTTFKVHPKMKVYFRAGGKSGQGWLHIRQFRADFGPGLCVRWWSQSVPDLNLWKAHLRFQFLQQPLKASRPGSVTKRMLYSFKVTNMA